MANLSFDDQNRKEFRLVQFTKEQLKETSLGGLEQISSIEAK